MDYLATNSAQGSSGGNAIINWSDRLLPSFSSQAGLNGDYEGAGGAIEYAVELCNETDRDLWFNIPLQASDQYVTDLALGLKFGFDANGNPYTAPTANPVYPPLNPNLKAYLELSNEVWNGGFYQNALAEQIAVAAVTNNTAIGQIINYDGIGTSFAFAVGQRWQILRTQQISNDFRAVWGNGAMMSTIRPIFQYFDANVINSASDPLQFLDNYFNNTDGNHVATPEPDNYYLYAAGADWYNGVNDASGTSIDAMYASGVQSITSTVQTEVDWDMAFGLQTVGYEGGFDVGGNNASATDYAANVDPQAQQATLDTINEYLQAGGNLPVVFNATGGVWAVAADTNGINNVYDQNTPKLAAYNAVMNALPIPNNNSDLVPGVLTPANMTVYYSSYYGTYADSGGGLYQNSGWLSWNINVAFPGTYTFTAATTGAGGSYDLLINEVKIASGSSGANVVGSITLSPGYYDLKIRSTSNTQFQVNQVTVALNGAETSKVGSLPARQTSDTFNVPATFSDPGSLVSSVDLYASANGGPFTLVQTIQVFPQSGSGSVTFSFTGSDRNIYTFHTIAHDPAGNTESKAANLIEASTYVPDLTPPVTHVVSFSPTYSWSPFSSGLFSNVPASSYSNGVFTLNVAGATVEQTSGTPAGSITTFQIYVEIDGGTAQRVATLSAGTANGNGVYSVSTTYAALGDGLSHTYAFYSVGIDDEGVTQAVPGSPDATFSGITFTSSLAASSLTVEHGIAERSYIRYLDVNFNQSLSSSPPSSALTSLSNGLAGSQPGAFVELEFYGENLTASSTPISAVTLFGSGTTTAVTLSGSDLSIDFGATGITGTPTSATGDGWYALGIDPTGNPSNNQVFWLTFYRLLGDANGDGQVTGPYTTAGTDASIVYLARGQSGAPAERRRQRRRHREHHGPDGNRQGSESLGRHHPTAKLPHVPGPDRPGRHRHCNAHYSSADSGPGPGGDCRLAKGRTERSRSATAPGGAIPGSQPGWKHPWARNFGPDSDQRHRRRLQLGCECQQPSRESDGPADRARTRNGAHSRPARQFPSRRHNGHWPGAGRKSGAYPRGCSGTRSGVSSHGGIFQRRRACRYALQRSHRCRQQLIGPVECGSGTDLWPVRQARRQRGHLRSRATAWQPTAPERPLVHLCRRGPPAPRRMFQTETTAPVSSGKNVPAEDPGQGRGVKRSSPGPASETLAPEIRIEYCNAWVKEGRPPPTGKREGCKNILAT